MSTKINFVINQKWYAHQLVGFLDRESYFYPSVSPNIYDDHKSLKTELEELKDYNSYPNTISKYLNQYYKNHDHEIKDYLKSISKTWNEKWPEIKTQLSEEIESDWQGIKDITCYIGVACVYPRYLDTNELAILYLDSIEFTESVILHEVTHFIYAKKWLDTFPNDSLDDLEAPHPFWHLSEIMMIVINDNQRFNHLVPLASKSYYSKEYDNSINLGSKISIMTHFKNTYSNYKKQGKSFSQFLKYARKEIQKNKTLDF
jgi:hypothetical protein